MFSKLSSSQRLSLIITLLVISQGAAIGGLSLAWSAGWVLPVSLLSALLAAYVVFEAGGAQRRFVSDFSQHAGRIATGDLTVDVHAEAGNGDAAAGMRALRDLQTSLRQAVGSIRGGADGVSLAAQEIAQGNVDLSTRTEQTATNLQQAASSLTQLTGTVNQTADSARTANQLASSAREVAARGGSVVAQVVTTMDEINASSKKIADIIGTIDGIAFQTNILALNAAVEAARAGEQGRGFAVVASEVRSLAQRSAEAARQIKSLIGASVEKVESGTRLVQDAGNTMSEIVASVQRVSDIIGEISAAAGEQSSGLGQVNTAVMQLDQMTQQNAALVEESAAAAESLKDQSRQLADALGSFRLNGVSTPAKALASSAIRQASSAAKRAPAPVKRAGATASTAAAAARPASAAKPASRPAAASSAAPTPRPAAAAAAPASDDDWETF